MNNEEKIIKTELSESMKLFIEQFTGEFEIDRIYCFGSRKKTMASNSIILNEAHESSHIHYDLLIITPELDDDIYIQVETILVDKAYKYISITPIIYSLDSIESDCHPNQFFFYNILKIAELIYLQPNLSKRINLPSHYDVPSALDIKNEWHKRFKRADALFLIATDNLEGCKDLIPAMLSASMVQLCLGFIYVFLEYYPNNYSLPYLFDLCRSVTYKVDTLFPRNTEEDMDLFNLIVPGFEEINYHTSNYVLTSDLDALNTKCYNWFEVAREMAEEKLKRLE